MKNKSKNYIITSDFFPHIIAIDMYQIRQGKIFLEKPGISPSFGFFQHFLALFDTFATRYDRSDIKFEFSGYFYPYEHFIKKYFLKNIQKCPSDLCALSPIFTK